MDSTLAERTNRRLAALLAPQITASLLAEVTGLVPADWLDDGSQDRYITHLLERAPRVLEVIR